MLVMPIACPSRGWPSGHVVGGGFARERNGFGLGPQRGLSLSI